MQLIKVDMLNFCVNAAKLYGEAAKLASKIKVNYPKPDNIIVAGMGGSAIGGDLLKDWARNKTNVPIEVNREYQSSSLRRQENPCITNKLFRRHRRIVERFS